MAIGKDPAELRELLSRLDRALEVAYGRMGPGAHVDDVLEARIRIREIQSRREHVILRLRTLAEAAAQTEADSEAAARALKDSGERPSVEEDALPRDEAGVRRA
jgi:hypothetical protein